MTDKSGMPIPMKIAVVIPAYDSDRRIGDVLSKCLRLIPRHQVIVVDDGSRDQTSAVAKSHGVQLLRHERNRGKGEALRMGIHHALNQPVEGIVTLDGDGQHDPGEIESLVKAMEEEQADLIVGCRRFKAGLMPFDRILSNRISSWLVSKCLHRTIPDSQCGFRLYRAGKLRSLRIEARRFEVETEMLMRAALQGWRIGFQPIRTLYNGSPSHIRRCRDTMDFLKTLKRICREKA